MSSVSFCLPTPFDILYLFTYRTRPMQTKIDAHTSWPWGNLMKTWWSEFYEGGMCTVPLVQDTRDYSCPIFRQLRVSLLMTISEFFTKTVYSLLTPLGFMIFVTNRWFSAWATLDDFRKEDISKHDVIIFSGICNKRGVFKIRAIKWLLQIIDFGDLCH